MSNTSTHICTFEIYCIKPAHKEWQKLDNTIREVFLKKLIKLINNPRIEKNRLRGQLSDCYKIKLQYLGYRLVYQVIDNKVMLLIWAIDKRQNEDVYDGAKNRLKTYQSDPNPIKLELE
jgi:mRNA interferase RelE/StbE